MTGRRTIFHLGALALLGLVLAGAATGQSATTVSPAESRPRTIVLITIDSLRADAVSSPARAISSTPFLASLGAEGVNFERAYAPSSWTSPSIATVFTGVYPASHGVETGTMNRKSGEVVGQPAISGQFTTLAERLRDAGYTTIGVPSSPYLSKRLGFSQGFDHYLDEAPPRGAPAVNLQVRGLLREAYGKGWKEEWKERKTFLWIHYRDLQAPYQARQPWILDFAPRFAEQPESYPAGLNEAELKEFLGKLNPRASAHLWPLYLSEIRFLDDRLERLSEDLGLTDPDVALLVTAAHGEELADHGGLGHGRTLFEEVVRVPFVFHWPAGARAGTQVRQPVSLVDIYPTLLDLAGVDRPFGLQGATLARVLRGGALKPDRPILLQLKTRGWSGGGEIAWTDGRWKLVRPERAKRPARLYDLWSDPREKRDVAAANPDRVRELEAELARGMSTYPAPPEGARRAVEVVEAEEDLESPG